MFNLTNQIFGIGNGEFHIDMIKKEGTVILLTATCEEKLGMGEVMANGDSKLFSGIHIDAVPS